ncbi:MAG: dihydroorotase [Eubacteriales bacterium]|nr:dihydroorotase [Eubacteriales bacterium]
MSEFKNIKRFTSGTDMTAAAGFVVDNGVVKEADIVDLFDRSEYIVFPGFCDVHVHFREPGFSYKETMKTGSMSAARGGYTAVCAMPNLKPVPDSVEHIKEEIAIIDKDACINVYPYASITVNEAGEELSDMEGLAPLSIAFSDDGRGIQDEAMMREAMIKAKSLGKMIVAHCEVNDLLHGGYIHDGVYAKEHGHRGICSESEWKEIERDVKLSEETGCAYHVCHISTKESVDIIRKAKARGVDVTCETGPHYLLMTDEDLKEDGRFKMNPPLRSAEDRAALIEGIKDGTIDMIITDHAPHSAEEKSRGLEKSAMGIVGLETAFASLYTGLVKTGVISLEKLIDLMVYAPRKRFNIPLNADDYCIWDLNREYTVDPEEFLSMGHATPFEGMKLFGRCLLTVCGGKIAYIER